MATPAIAVNGLAKRYSVGRKQEAGYRTLRESITNGVASGWRRLSPWGQRARRAAAAPTSVWALRDVSFEVGKGEVVGVLGINGAGKSTLLKIISRITEPTRGRALLRGRVGSLLEVGTGFHPELTGRENIYLAGAILSMSRQEVRRQLDAIVAFAEIDEYLDTPVKRYSSGMYLRLGFAIAAHTMPDILLIDEVLAVGDLKFQRKCMEHTKQMRDRNATTLIVSHNMFAIKATCTRAIYLSDGKVSVDGAPEEAIRMYEQDSRLGTLPWAQDKVSADPLQRHVCVTNVEVRGEDGTPRCVFDHGERVRVRVECDARTAVSKPNVCVSFIRSDSVACCNYNTAMDGAGISWEQGKQTVEVLTPPLKLVAEMYTIHVLVWDASFTRLYTAQMGPTFHVRHDVLNTHFGVFHEPGEWHWASGGKN
jgi:lipopolysaccharide transport system ATP-binding protein